MQGRLRTSLEFSCTSFQMRQGSKDRQVRTIQGARGPQGAEGAGGGCGKAKAPSTHTHCEWNGSASSL